MKNLLKQCIFTCFNFNLMDVGCFCWAEKKLCIKGKVYSVDLKSGLVWISNGRKKVVLQMVRILNGIWNLKAEPFEIWTMAVILSKTLWNPDKMSKFWMFGNIAMAIALARPFENRTIWNPILKEYGFWMFLDFNWSDFRSLLYCFFNNQSCVSL